MTWSGVVLAHGRLPGLESTSSPTIDVMPTRGSDDPCSTRMTHA